MGGVGGKGWKALNGGVYETYYQNGIFLINADDIVNGDNFSGSPIVLFAGMGKLPI
jgi:hypothetical protein